MHRSWRREGFDGTDAAFPVSRVFCVGRNYAEHAVEMGHDPDREPPFFMKPPRWCRLAGASPSQLIMTGTPAGVGRVVPGDALEGHIDGVGDVRVEYAQREER